MGLPENQGPVCVSESIVKTTANSGAPQWRRTQVMKHVLEALEPAGFKRQHGAYLLRDTGLKTEIEFASYRDEDAGLMKIDNLISFTDTKNTAPGTTFTSGNFFRLENIAGHADSYMFPDGIEWEKTDLAKDLATGTLTEFFTRINSCEAAYNFFMSDGDKYGNRKVRISQRDGDLDKRDSILLAHALAVANQDGARADSALDALKQYANQNAEAYEEVVFLLEAEPNFPLNLTNLKRV
jgi:hypothetical protein